MKTIIKGKEFIVKKTGNKYYYFSALVGRWLPISKVKVIFND